MLPTDLAAAADAYVLDGAFAAELASAVAHRTVSSDPGCGAPLDAYHRRVVAPVLEGLGFAVRTVPNSVGGWPFLLASRVEDPARPTVLLYGHADVVDVSIPWRAGLDPWTLTREGDRWYGRGSADNKGQHLLNLAALRLLLEHRGMLGFNVTFLLDGGEEVGSPGLAELAAVHGRDLRADVLVASDGPRVAADRPTLFLGTRAAAQIRLDVDLRADARHSGNWGGVLRNPATTLAGAIGTLVDGHGRVLVPALLPPGVDDEVRAALARVPVEGEQGWGEPGLSAAERLHAGNTLEVLALEAGDVERPVGAIPGRARAVLQLRHVAGTDVSRLAEVVTGHLRRHGFGMVRVTAGGGAAGRTPLSDPWVVWAREVLEPATGGRLLVLPSLGGTLPNRVFTEDLGLATLWVPHSYPGCGQHAADEHLPVEVARDGLRTVLALFEALGRRGTSPR
ncbi:M20/M25/M40 family metallo-hydrolase [Kineococcus rhizosphaerae]|uniref:Acetylornithine deacetylase/succinyl-diaminopimelate desuccinylase-like protein n=1 Tax=Kineococcus rhizosphaerae TaxID=559628 RepID=A0A2T0RAD7_9ACTN|nr:M20/M25/M40 family metallo-hydrolase [Kineococcus rhizosphaerae]PRY18091.1 acetylornithine deacetylase/succinyl-diaminopimelate desuccinylase-like protein [Kineococcus rhizosphaerae]